jgi:hypothetical protein
MNHAEHYVGLPADEMSDKGIHMRALEPYVRLSVCHRWRCMRVARIARTMN